ncbi:MAG TPA: hypothetical protein P5323_00140 [Candidatus Moranbacteria bacterium]|nr:hypothetical protein [Candidatus Moranbacteria bacterium]HRY27534.1 hypothetical protein [Candidatus Moranbacteria bacterium]HSA07763.1 hypothetical protein [Candidatus Moranbacteria bacterium]
MKNKRKILFFLTVFSFLITSSAKAICPICTVAVGAGVGLSRWLGIDDTITGLWIGGLTVSMIMWTIDWLGRKNVYFKKRKTIIAVVYYLLIVAPLYWMDIIGHPFNKIWGIDKLFLGIVFGSIVFWSGANWYFYLKAKNNGHAYFPFQKVAMPVGPLIILSFIFYFLTK